MKNILIVEDEILIASVLKKYIEQAGYKCAGIAVDYDEAVNLISKKHVDFIFMDITIKGEKSGLDVAKYVNSHHQIPFIYLTSHSDSNTIEEISETSPIGYLSKPFKAIDVTTSLQLFFKTQNETVSTFKLKINTAIYHINLKEIIYAEADHIYVQLHLKSEHLTLRIALAKLIETLPHGCLVRINRGVAINPEYITKVNKNYISIEEREFKLTNSYSKEYNYLLK